MQFRFALYLCQFQDCTARCQISISVLWKAWGVLFAILRAHQLKSFVSLVLSFSPCCFAPPRNLPASSTFFMPSSSSFSLSLSLSQSIYLSFSLFFPFRTSFFRSALFYQNRSFHLVRFAVVTCLALKTFKQFRTKLFRERHIPASRVFISVSSLLAVGLSLSFDHESKVILETRRPSADRERSK